MTSSLRSITRVSTAKATVFTGLQIGAGYAGVNALRSLEGRFGLDGLMARLPGGIVNKVGEYVLKFVNTSLAAALAGMVGKRGFANQVRAGGLANIGVNLFSDVAGLFGGMGETARQYLHGIGDYNLAYNMGTAMHPYPALGNYNLASGGQAMDSVSGAEVYPDLSSIYG